MRYRTLVYRSLVFYRRTYITVFLGVVVSTAILVGALVVGDSVRYSLKRLALNRLGGTEFALVSEERFFRVRLADDISARLGREVVPVIQLRGVAVSEGGLHRANRVQVLGVDSRFWALGRAAEPSGGIGPDEAVVNKQLAAKLGLREGDEFLLRVDSPDLMPSDAPLSSDKRSSFAILVKVKSVAGDSGFGRFSLRANQAAPLNVFLSLTWLGERMELAGRANMMLVEEGAAGSRKEISSEAMNEGDAGSRKEISPEILNEALKKSWQLSDAGLELRKMAERNVIELRSNRVFLDTPVADAAINTGINAEGVLTYFVNGLHHGNRLTPYSFVSAPGKPLVPEDMKDDEIIINEWLAGDLGIFKSEDLSLTYFVPGPAYNLIEKTSTFRVRSVVSIEGRAADMELMPEFPGLAEVDNCRDWDPGIPIDLNKIRKKDERYWDLYKGTPKAFITLAAAQRIWTNRFGSLTAVRYPGDGRTSDEIATELLKKLEPASLGFEFLPVRQQGIQAGMGAVDFGQLFLGLSIFIIITALMLTGLLFVFGIEHRSLEAGTLLALGLPVFRIRRLLFAEGAIIAVIGSIPGTALGILYNQVILFGLSTVWHGAVGTQDIRLYVRGSTLLTGALSGIGAALFAMWLASGRQKGRKPARLLEKGPGYDERHAKRDSWISLLIAGFSIIGALTIIGVKGQGRGREATGIFFTAGALLLIGGLGICSAVLFGPGRKRNTGSIGIIGMGLRNCARRRGRSLAFIGLLACGVFIVAAVGSNRSNSVTGLDRRESGTGGFAFFGETTMPVIYDLNSEKGRRRFGLWDIESSKLSFVQIRVREGDDASCLNLNHVQSPRILGVTPEEFAKRGAFSFVRTDDGDAGGNPWLLLNKEIDRDTVPAIADQTVILWGLNKAIGDTVMYKDERGREFRLKLVGGLENSVFQGNILISEEAFVERFPSISGSRVFLIDVPEEEIEQVSNSLSKALQDFGLELTPSAIRLMEFNKVQNTYLSIYLFLGGLGLILGSFGIGVIVFRNVLEARGELALLRAVGFNRRSIRRMLLAEHLPLIAAGLFCGTAAAVVAVLPAIKSYSSDAPFAFLGVILAAIAASGSLWTYLAVNLSTRGDLVPALRNE